MEFIKALNQAGKGFWLGCTVLGVVTVSVVLYASFQKISYTYTHYLLLVGRQADEVFLLLQNPSVRSVESTRQQLLRFNEVLATMRQGVHTQQNNPYDELLAAWFKDLNPKLLPLEQEWQKYLKELSRAQVDQTRLASILTTNARNYQALLAHLQRKEVQSKEYVNYLTFLMAGVLLVCAPTIALFFLKQVVYPLREIAQVAHLTATGNLSRKVQYRSGDEMGKVAQALNQIIDNQLQLSVFATGIGKGDYQATLPVESKAGSLGAVLQDMRDTLHQVSVEDQKRKWTTEGLATFGELLRSHQADLQVLGKEFITKLVNYMGANQGALFLLYRDENEGPYLEPLSAYAWERQRHLKERIAFGEGLVGQSAREVDTLYITDVPEDYISITSGLGRATPRSILIVPLRANEEVQGVIEIASFKPLETFQIEFVEKIGQIAASTLVMAKTNSHTRSLLEEAQHMNEQLKAQEEFLREMSEKLEYAKQEMRQQIQDLQAEKAKNTAILEGCVDGVICFDGLGTVEFINKAAEEIWLVARQEVVQHSIRQLLPLGIAGSEITFASGNTNKTIGNRTEVSFRNRSDQDVDVLLTLSKAQVGETYTFTLFVQKISVDLF